MGRHAMIILLTALLIVVLPQGNEMLFHLCAHLDGQLSRHVIAEREREEREEKGNKSNECIQSKYIAVREKHRASDSTEQSNDIK